MTGVIKRMLAHKHLTEKEAQNRAAFLASAKGDIGERGPAGIPGERGAVPRHEWQGTTLRFEQADGTWGKAVDLQGKPGKPGDAGRIVVVGRGGRSGTDLSDLLPGSQNVEPAGIAVMQGGQWVNLPWSAFIQTITGAVDMASELSRRTDFVGDTVVYRGEAAPGASETSAVWRIKKIEFVTGEDGKQDVNEYWAGGDATFTNAWADRATLGYL
jgi:hypothetical protein